MTKQGKTISILAVDIGNTAMSFAHIKGAKITALGHIKSGASKAAVAKGVGGLLKKIKGPIEAVLICSVEPKAKQKLLDVLKKKTAVKVYVIGKDIKVPLKNKYNPKQIGQDRLVCAYAASVYYGTPALIVDLGTATTLDVVSGRQGYLGGIIVPGIEMSADSLFQKTALLPKIKIGRPQALIGKDTPNSILSGIFYGYGEMISGLIGLIAKKFRQRTKVIATGGYLQLMKKHIAGKVTAFDKFLVFKGMAALWEQRND